MREYYVYILSNDTHRLYVAIISDLYRTVILSEAKNPKPPVLTPSFPRRQNLFPLDGGRLRWG